MAQHLISCGACGGLSPITLTACLHCDASLVRRAKWARWFHLLAGGGFMMTLAACYGAAYRPGPSYAGHDDRDYDGAYTPADCDDTRADRFPGAADPDGDGVDQNCDGVDGWRDPAVIADP
jgi:hypothetical protein